MDNQPRTRKESKKDPREKSHGNKYGSQKHVRQMEALREKNRGTSNTSSKSKTQQEWMDRFP